MKRLSKVFILLLMVTAFVAPIFKTTLTAFAESPIASYGAEIVVTQIPQSGQIGSTINIPKGTSADGTVTVTLKDSKGATVNLVDAGSTYTFNPVLSGTYKLQYAVISADETIMASTYSKEYSIVISGDKPSFNFDTNSMIILPENSNYGNLMVIPYPVVYASNGELVDATYVANNIDIIVTNPQGGKQSNTGEITHTALGEITIEGITYFTFTPQEANGEGVYTIDYYYADAVTGLTARHAKTLTVDNSFNSSSIELGYTLSSTMPESAILGNEVKLPKPVTRNRAEGNVLLTTYTLVEVTFLGSDEQASESVTVNDFSFVTPYKGDYKIVYKVYDYYALENDEPLGEYTYTIKNVKDTEAPQVKAVDTYDEVEADNVNYDFLEIAYTIPSNVAVGTTVSFPAIHAIDNYSLSSDLNYERTIVDANNTITNLDYATNYQYDYNEVLQYTLTTEGTYTVRYSAIDEAGNKRTISYTLKVVDGFVDNVAPRITMPSLPVYAKVGDTVKFLKPTAIDYVSSSSTSTVDSRLEVKVYFYLGDNTGLAIQIFEDEEDSNYYSFVIPTEITEDYIHILVEAKDDGFNSSSEQNVGTKTQKINLLDVTDTITPVIVGDQPIMTAQNQGSVVNLPTVKFSDDNPTFVSVSVDVKDPNGNKVPVSGLQLAYELDTLNPGDADGIKVMAGKFNAVLAGNYRITYTATDVANNAYIISYTQYINDTQAPTFQVSNIPSNVEVGETITLPIARIMDNGEEIENEALTTIVFIDSPAYYFNLTTYEFTALEEGVYSFQYLAEDEFGNESESAVYSFTVSDNIDPTITLNDEIAFPFTAPLEKENPEDTSYKAIIIPDFVAYDEFNGIREFSVTVKNPSGSTILDSKNGDGATNGTYSFIPTKDGSYTVTYSATDLAGNTVNDVKTVKVGDTAAPTLTIGNTTVNKPGNKKINSTITLDLSTITIADIKDGEIELDDTTSTGNSKFVVTLTGPNGATINPAADTHTYTLSQSGEYTLTYTARDEAGNTKVVSHVFQVSADETEINTITGTIAIILIILAVLALGGVVVYFIRSREIIED